MPAAAEIQQLHETPHDLRYDPLSHYCEASPDATPKHKLVCVAHTDCEENQLEDNYVELPAVADVLLPNGFDRGNPHSWPKYRPTLYDHRHCAVRDIMRWLEPNQKLPSTQWEIAHEVWQLADSMINQLPDGPELTAALRKLLEAKDCLVRASISAEPVSE